ncbi:helix-turn-helix domain-containing protein [Neobacillus sp. MM2021_6]|uniref:LexA family protein n=1 Tax=Bacillaceae TaxID=186817 RepID=UPI00140805A6|nr:MULTISPECIES: XRE family transcriptional regulator [Bacillaceae]MBO0961964.1 helix-turn-helix domain-containing protein [Neobacillus sp. MM2021_6]NHC20339.1 helix-turn-helix domain-containing protein [Bacillus sp. MM2020_4]
MKKLSSQREVFSKNLQRLLNTKGIDQKDLADHLKVSETSVSYWTQGKKYPRIDKIQMMADFFHVEKTELIEERPSNLYEIMPQTVKVPVLGTIACGDPIYAEENFAGYRNESPDTLPSGKIFYLEAKGKSMEPTIPNSSFVLIRKQEDVENGEIAAVLVNGDTEATLKRVKKQGNVIMLLPDNPAFPSYIINEENPARIIGKAIRYTRDL